MLMGGRKQKSFQHKTPYQNTEKLVNTIVDTQHRPLMHRPERTFLLSENIFQERLRWLQTKRHLKKKKKQTNKKNPRGLPWWRSGWESACQCRGHGFEPWSGKIPHAAERLVPWATTTEPARLEPVLRNKRSRDSERPTHRDEEWPPPRRN